jgi:hypothetical protein
MREDQPGTSTDGKWGHFKPSGWGQCKSSLRPREEKPHAVAVDPSDSSLEAVRAPQDADMAVFDRLREEASGLVEDLRVFAAWRR